MDVKFGTSGLRGLVTDLTNKLISDYVRAFLSCCETGGKLFVGYDLRASSPNMAKIVIQTALNAGVDVIDCGALPTPALALAAQETDGAALMITGSHIPADRNGLKFYSTKGEILKDEEEAIVSALGQRNLLAKNQGNFRRDTGAGTRFVARYVDAFGAEALKGLRIGVYSHSAVGRDLLCDLLVQLGGDVVELGRSEIFIPVDTEAQDPDVVAKLKRWIKEHELDAIASTDGDSDRPMMIDEVGRVIPGDILGQITCTMMAADVVVTPVSSNTGVLAKGFDKVLTTKIGSPFVIAEMENHAEARTAGYEANGGFLLGFMASGAVGELPPLMTRDSFLPIVSTLYASRKQGLSAMIAEEPHRFTAADRLQDVSILDSNNLVATLRSSKTARASFLSFTRSSEADLDETDGLRITLLDGSIIHIRPSGNAPELRLYVESTEKDKAFALLSLGLSKLGQLLKPDLD